MKQNTTQTWKTKIDKLLSNLLLIGIALIIISLPLVNISIHLSDGNGTYAQEWAGGPIAAIGIFILATLFATKKIVYESKNPMTEHSAIIKKSILFGFIYSIAFIMIVLGLATVVNMIFFFVEGGQKYSQSTVTFSSLSNYSLFASILLSLTFSPVLVTWITKKKEEFKKEYYNHQLATARNYEYAMNYDAAIAIYEELGLWDDAKRCREKKMSSVQK